jgi:hypothetical protein
VIKNKISELLKDSEKREILLDALCAGITNTSDFRDALEYVITKLPMFDIPEFESIYEDEDDILDLVLPSFRRVWGNIYVNPPTLFKNDQRLEMFILSFDIDEFLGYLKDMFIKTKGCLTDFNYIDRTPNHLQLIVDNYIAFLVKKVLDCKDYIEETRELKLKKMIK